MKTPPASKRNENNTVIVDHKNSFKSRSDWVKEDLDLAGVQTLDVITCCPGYVMAVFEALWQPSLHPYCIHRPGTNRTLYACCIGTTGPCVLAVSAHAGVTLGQHAQGNYVRRREEPSRSKQLTRQNKTP